MIIDASVVVAYLVQGEGAKAAAAALRTHGLVAPHLVDPEVGHALRSHVRAQRVSAERARTALDDLADLPIDRVPHTALVPRAWALRDNLTFYDAMYVALAELLDEPLVTFDERLANAPGHHAAVTVLRA